MEVKLKPGDIILWGTKNGKFDGLSELAFRLQKRFDGKASHAEMVYEYHSPDSVKTMGSNFDGVKWRAHIVKKPYVAILRPKLSQRYSQRNKDLVIRNIIRKYYEKLKRASEDKYDYIGLFDAAINAFLHTVSFKQYRKRRLFSSTKYPFCSEAVCQLNKEIFESFGDDFQVLDENNNIIPLSVVSPSDLYRDTENFELIKDFEI